MLTIGFKSETAEILYNATEQQKPCLGFPVCGYCSIRRDNKLEQREGQFTCFSNVTGNINILFH